MYLTWSLFCRTRKVIGSLGKLTRLRLECLQLSPKSPISAAYNSTHTYQTGSLYLTGSLFCRTCKVIGNLRKLTRLRLECGNESLSGEDLTALAELPALEDLTLHTPFTSVDDLQEGEKKYWR